MKISGKFVVYQAVFLAILLLKDQTGFSEIINKKTFPADLEINSLMGDGKSRNLYVSGKSGAYEIYASGIKKLVLPAGIQTVRAVCRTKNILYCVSDNGIFEMDINDHDGSWRRRSMVNGAEGVDLYGYNEDQIIVWDKKTIYMIGPDEVVKLKVITGEENIHKVKTAQDKILMLTDEGCMVMDKTLKSWKKILWIDSYSSREAGDMTAEDTDQYEELSEAKYAPDINSDGNIAVISAFSGVYLFDLMTEKLEVLQFEGVPSSRIKLVAAAGNIVLAATSDKLYRMERKGGSVREIFQSEGTVDLTVLRVYEIRDEHIFLWTGGENILFEIKLPEEIPESKNFFLNDIDIVSVKEVQGMAIQYAEVDPEKIAEWRKGAKLKAILPKVSVGLSESNDENIEIYKSATTYYVVNGPREVGRDWSIDLSWDLSDLIWNDAQTNIDVRSKLMVQMRNDILEDVTRLYFERKRLMGEISAIADTPGKDKDLQEKELRVQEITAYIDAYTGGRFSENIFSKKKKIADKHNNTRSKK